MNQTCEEHIKAAVERAVLDNLNGDAPDNSSPVFYTFASWSEFLGHCIVEALRAYEQEKWNSQGISPDCSQ